MDSGTGIVGRKDVVGSMAVGTTGVVPGALAACMHRMGVALGLDHQIHAVALQPGHALGGGAGAQLEVAAHAVHPFQTRAMGQLADVLMAVEALVVAVHALVQGVAIDMQRAHAAFLQGRGKPFLTVAAQAVGFGDLCARDHLLAGEQASVARGRRCGAAGLGGEGEQGQQAGRKQALEHGGHSLWVNSG